jgi:hypothetical protein
MNRQEVLRLHKAQHLLQLVLRLSDSIADIVADM